MQQKDVCLANAVIITILYMKHKTAQNHKRLLFLNWKQEWNFKIIQGNEPILDRHR